MYKKKNALYPPPEGRGITAQKVKQAKRKVLPKGATQALRNARKKSTLNGHAFVSVRVYKFPSLKRILKSACFGSGPVSSLIKLKF